MEVLSRVFNWIGTNESVLSGIAATIVILGVLYIPIRKLLQRPQDPAPPSSIPATPLATPDSSLRPAAILHTESPSIAVMPFANLSGDPEHEFLADGLTEDIILGLSRVKQLFVIARNTCFTYKGTTPDAQVVSHELGVRYVLEGSVRRTGDRIRVTAQLVDASTRTPKWAERFDRKIKEILDVDDEVTEAIVAALQPALRRAEAEHARRSSPDDLTAWSLVNQAWVGVQSDLGDEEAANAAIVACNKALSLDSTYAFGHAVLAHAVSLLVNNPTHHEVASEAAARASINRALELSPDDGLVHHCHAAVLANLGQTRDAIVAWKRAVELDPNSAGARAGLGIGMIFSGKAAEALDLIESALKRSPADPLRYHWLCNQALALLLTRRVPEAIEVAQASLQRKPSRLGYAVLACALANEDRASEAVDAWKELSERFEPVISTDYGSMLANLAPDAEWGTLAAEKLREVLGD